MFPTDAEWKLANLLADRQKLFVLWNVRSQLCRNLEDFQRHYGPGFPTAEILDELKQDGFLRTGASEFTLTDAGIQALEYLGKAGPDRAARNEVEAADELRKILMDISGAGITSEFIHTMRDRAKNIYHAFSSSSAVSDLYRRILTETQPSPRLEPESCRALREQLAETVTARQVVVALKASGFYQRTDVSVRESDCYRNAIHGALQTLRASYEVAEGDNLERLQAKIVSLREVLDALPPAIEAPRREVEEIVYKLELKAAGDRFVIWLKRLRERVEAQDFANIDRTELQFDLWAQVNSTAPEVAEAQQHFARLEELNRAFGKQLEDSEHVRDLIDFDQDYDQALNEIRLIDVRLRKIGLRNRKPLNSVLDHLVDQFEGAYLVEAAVVHAAADEATLKESRLNLGRLTVQLEKVPETHRAKAEPLYRKAAELSEKLAVQLNNLRLHAAREELRLIPVEGVPAYIDQLRFSGLPGTRDWADKVESVLEALNHVRRSQEPVDSVYLIRLEHAEEHLGPAPLTQAANEAVQEWKDSAARDYLWESNKLVEALEKIALDHINVQELGQAISEAVANILQYRQYQESKLFSETQSKYQAEHQSLDERVLHVRQLLLPGAVRRWAGLIAKGSSVQEIGVARQRFFGWHDVLGADLARKEIEQVLNDRSAEIEIRGLLEARKFSEALKVLHDSGRLLSLKFIREFTDLLGRRQTAERYTPGEEARVAEAIEKYGPDSELLQFLVADFTDKGQVDYLAQAYGRIQQIEQLEPHTAYLVRWAFEFKSAALEQLAHSLATSDDTQCVLTFAKGLANSPDHISALHVLQLALKEQRTWTPKIQPFVMGVAAILWTRFTETRSRIETALNALIERCEAEEKSTPIYDGQSDAVLQQEIEEAFATAQAFLDTSLDTVEHWLTYLTTAARFELDSDDSLRKRAQELDVRLRSNMQYLDRLAGARRAVESEGWRRLNDLPKAINAVIATVPPVTVVVQLLNRYLKDYQPTTQVIDELLEAWENNGIGLSSSELTSKVKRLKGELKYDIRTGQDRFQQLKRLSGRPFEEFVEELRVMVAEIEAVRLYKERLFNAMAGKEELLHRHIAGGSKSDRQAVVELLQQPDSLGQSMLDWYHNPPDTSHSRAAEEHLRALQHLPRFELLTEAVSFTRKVTNAESTQDLIQDV